MYELRIHTVPMLLYRGRELVEVGQEHSAMNGEVPGLTVTVDNARGQHTQQVAAVEVLRVAAELWRDADLAYAGVVQSVVLGAAIEFGLEA